MHTKEQQSSEHVLISAFCTVSSCSTARRPLVCIACTWRDCWGKREPAISVSLSDLFVSTRMLLSRASRSLNPAAVKTTLIRPLLSGIQMTQLHQSVRLAAHKRSLSEVRASVMSGSPRERRCYKQNLYILGQHLHQASVRTLGLVSSVHLSTTEPLISRVRPGR